VYSEKNYVKMREFTGSFTQRLEFPNQLLQQRMEGKGWEQHDGGVHVAMAQQASPPISAAKPRAVEHHEQSKSTHLIPIHGN
jgi:hypothetical protein